MTVTKTGVKCSFVLSLEQRAHLVALYAEPRRHYHTLDHVQQLLREIDMLNVADDVRDVLCCAAWFHDSVYDPFAARGRNEEASYEMMMYSALGNMTGKLAAGRCILATVDHKIPESVTDEDARNTIQTFLDLDLSILGKPEDVYQVYANFIHLEYVLGPSGISEEDYIKGRKAFLRTMLARPAIYKTKHFVDKYEAQARRNMERELKMLETSVTLASGNP